MIVLLLPRCIGCKNVEEGTGRKKELARHTLNGASGGLQLGCGLDSMGVASSSEALSLAQQQQQLEQLHHQLTAMPGMASSIQGDVKPMATLRSKLAPNVGSTATAGTR